MDRGGLDTGHFFHTSPAQCLILKAYFDVKNPKFWSILGAKEVFEGIRSRKEKMATTRIIFGAKNKVMIDFIEEKLMEFLLFNEVLKNLIFFLITYQKS